MSDRRIFRHLDTVALAGLLAATTLLFAPALAGWLPGARDLLHWSLPGRALWRDAILSGHLPEWNPYVGMGLPLLAAPVHGTLYPGHVLLLLGPAYWSVPFCWFVHTLVAAGGAYAVARTLGCRPAAALLAGLVWSVGGYAVSMWENGEKILSSAWIPWTVFGLVRLWRARSRPGRTLVGTAVAMALTGLAGDPFLVGHSLLLGLPLACAASDFDGRWQRNARLVLTRAAATVGLALLLASPALLPAWSVIGLSERAGGIAADRAELWSLHPVRLLEFVAPGALGNVNHAREYPGAAFVADPGLGFTPWALSLYAGMAALLLAPLAGRRRIASALWISAGVGLLLALGRHLPGHGLAAVLIPPLRYFRYPEKHILVSVAALAWLGALGAERVLREEVHLRRLAPFALLCGALALLLAPASLRASVVGGLLHSLLAGSLLVAALILSRRRHGWTWLVPAVAACDLIVAAFPLLQWFDGSLLARPPPIAERINRHQRELAPARLYRPDQAGARYDTLAHNLGLLFGIAHVPGHESALPASFHRLWDRLAGSGPRALALLDVGWAFLPDGPVPPDMVAVARDEGWQLVQTTRPARARLLHRVEIADDASALARLGDADFDPYGQALVAPGPASLRLDGAEPGETCAIESFAGERVSVRCSSRSPGLLVLAEHAYPGWSATVDGRAAPIVRANLVMRGVFLSSGEHQIHFQFRTPHRNAGLVLAAFGLLAGLALALRSR
jgi:hypothetical protein